MTAKDTFDAKLRQLEKQQLAEMVNITTYWLETRPTTFPYDLSKSQSPSNDYFSLEKAVLLTLSGALCVLELQMPREFRRGVYHQGESAYLVLQRHPHDARVLAAWRKQPDDKEHQHSASEHFASELYDATGMEAGGIEDNFIRTALTEILEKYLFERGLNLANHYTTVDKRENRVVLRWQPPHIE